MGAEEARVEEEGPGANAREVDARDTGTARARWGDPENEEGQEEAAAKEEPDEARAEEEGPGASAREDDARDTGTARARWGDPENEEGKEEAAATEEPDAFLPSMLARRRPRWTQPDVHTDSGGRAAAENQSCSQRREKRKRTRKWERKRQRGGTRAMAVADVRG